MAREPKAEAGSRKRAGATRGDGVRKTATRTAPDTPADATEGGPPTPDMAPHASAERMKGDHAPPSDPSPNPAMLKADIDSGRTDDKNEVFDPGMSMLGTDDEVAGTPASPERIRMARVEETSRATDGAPRESQANIARTGRGRIVAGFVIGIVLFAVLFALILFGVG